MFWAILSIFLFWPFGIPALYFSAQVKGKYAAGEYVGARDSSNKARSFSLVATILFIIAFVIFIIVVVVVMQNIPSDGYNEPGY